MKNLKNMKKKWVIIFIIFGIFIIPEIVNISNDIYNFQQIHKIKKLLKSSSKETYNFRRLEEFNKEYKTNIHLKGECLYLTKSDKKNSEGYAMGYFYQAYLFRIFYFSSFYSSVDVEGSYYMLCGNGGCYPTKNFKKYLNNLNCK